MITRVFGVIAFSIASTSRSKFGADWTTTSLQRAVRIYCLYSAKNGATIIISLCSGTIQLKRTLIAAAAPHERTRC